MSDPPQACCSSPASIGYWFVISFGFWVVLSLIGVYWHPLRALSAETILFSMAIGCIANWIRNRTLHCGITAPLFLVLGLMSLLADLRIMHFSSGVMWTLILIGVGTAFLLEWRYAKHDRLTELGSNKRQ